MMKALSRFSYLGKREKTYKVQYFVIANGKEISGETFDVAMDGDTDRDELITPDHKIFDVLPKESVDTHIKKIDVSLDIDHRSSPSFQFLLMATDVNTTQIDSHTFKVDFCTEHTVDLQLNSKKVHPNQDVTLHLKSEPGALCGLSLIDKSVDLLGNPNKVNKERIVELLETNRPYVEHHLRYSTCDKLQMLAETGRSFISNIPLFTNCKSLIEKDDEEELYFATSNHFGFFWYYYNYHFFYNHYYFFYCTLGLS